MRHHDTRAPAHERRKRILDKLLALGVESTRGLVEHEHGTISQKGARNRHALTLPTREFHAALASDRVETFRQPLDELERVRQPRRLADFLRRRVGAAVGYVLGDRAVEQQRLLGDVGNLAAKRLLRAASDVLPIQQMLPSWISERRSNSFVKVVLPAPLIPTRPTRSPGRYAS